MISLSASAGFGYGGKQYIARITGRHPKFTFEREFIGRKGGKRNESCEADVDTPGLYECRDVDRKGNVDDSWHVVMEDAEDSLRISTGLGKEEAMTIAKRLGDGEAIERIVEMVPRPSRRDPTVTVWDANLITPRQAEQRQTAQTIDSAVEACWAALQALPEKDAKKVLSQLRLRVSPPKMGLAEDAPVGVVSDAAQDAGASAESLGLTPTQVQPE